MSDDVEALARAQTRAFEVYGDKIPDYGALDHVVMSCELLAHSLDSEVRHVTLSGSGLENALAQVFVEALCALRGREVDGKELPWDIRKIADHIRESVFASKNREYGSSFARFGAVGVVIRLVDQSSRMGRGHAVTTSLIHVANYAAMAMMMLLEPKK